MNSDKHEDVQGAMPEGWQGAEKEMIDALGYCIKALETPSKTGREFALKNASEVLALARRANYTCISTGDKYELIGTAQGAGSREGAGAVRVYRDAAGTLLYTTQRDFDARMEETLMHKVRP